MIKNIIFDLGNVLLEFKPAQLLEEKYSDPELRERCFMRFFKVLNGYY